MQERLRGREVILFASLITVKRQGELQVNSAIFVYEGKSQAFVCQFLCP